MCFLSFHSNDSSLKSYVFLQNVEKIMKNLNNGKYKKKLKQ